MFPAPRHARSLEPARARPREPVHRSQGMRIVMDQVVRVAAAPRTTVLITGESGVGKELVAHAVHRHSVRAAGPFVAVNCAALTEGLLEAELFGYEPGAFTGAAARGRRGLFAASQGGSLFLDEVGELAPGLQAKLLRALQERVYRPVGSERDQAFDTRILASTNRELEELVSEGGFRADLFYRLNVMRIRVPALRERPEDVEPLARHFLDQAAQELAAPPAGLSPAALQALLEHAWPGNVRELRNAIERAVVLSAGAEIEPGHLDLGEVLSPAAPQGAAPARPSFSADSLPLGDRTLAGVERALIERVVAEAGGNRSRAARILGVDRSTLYHKLRRYGIAAGTGTGAKNLPESRSGSSRVSGVAADRLPGTGLAKVVALPIPRSHPSPNPETSPEHA